jgi:hypothetical protein
LLKLFQAHSKAATDFTDSTEKSLESVAVFEAAQNRGSFARARKRAEQLRSIL